MNENRPINALKNNSKTTGAWTFLLLLLAADCAFIFMHGLLHTDMFYAPLLSLERDRGYPEIYQFIKEFWVVVLLLFILIKTRFIGYGVWALLFLYLLFDDALEIHEKFGGYLATRFDFAPRLGLRGRDFGELLVSAMAAGLLLTSLVLPYVRGAVVFKQATRHLLSMLFMLAFFGVFVDMLHIMIPGRTLKFLLGILEDGGEMVIMSLIAWYVYLLNALDGTVGITLRSSH